MTDAATTDERSRAEDVLDHLRRPSRHPLLFRGFGPLVVAVLVVIAMMLMLPSVAPERIVERPAGSAEVAP